VSLCRFYHIYLPENTIHYTVQLARPPSSLFPEKPAAIEKHAQA